ncbi:sarcosine oxidase subunit gamma [Marinomonas sp. 15G1-11]|uniref:Sarcosine oxidase subunit gamma n=1 Tax=Marinomonas phaeophyticola TaxID=3004091 RepID=A0ABT4JWI5_9GAMM|nr:sarcosine oxidase subunit gamma family protein [Marinomonas sp. 15G1-11]MCZ2722576.1 sarcosine oxidase subunit gamma [Marinomonas sp. 15G1-11]
MSDNTTAQETVTPIKAAVMDQLPSAAIQGQSPLHHADLDSLAQQGPKTGGVHLREHKLLCHLTLRCNQGDEAQKAAVERVLGLALPLSPLTSVEKGDYSIRWLSPDEWLILAPGLEAFDIETKFRTEMPGHYSLVNSSGGSTVLELSGENAIDVLKRSVSVDLHASVFPIGKVVSTTFAKSTAILRRKGDHTFELIIRRSFADYIWLWLQDTSREFGLVIDA